MACAVVPLEVGDAQRRGDIIDVYNSMETPVHWTAVYSSGIDKLPLDIMHEATSDGIPQSSYSGTSYTFA